ncbi:MAG: Yip1 family protein [Caulobacteraceae bacterium]
MAADEASGPVSLLARARGVLFRSEVEWEVIDTEPATVLGLFIGYACILAAIRPLAQIPQHLVVSHLAPASAAELAAIGYGISLLDVLIMGLVINVLARSYHGHPNFTQAMKLAVYAGTPAWVAGALDILPIPGFFTLIAGLYGLYILCLGLPRLMKTPREDVAGYYVGVVFAAFAVNLITGWGMGLLNLFLLGGAPLGAAALVSPGR